MLIELRSIFREIPYNLRLFIAVILQGIVSGLSGIFLHYLLEMAEWLAFGHSEHHNGFLTDGVSSSRIGLSLIIVGLSSSLVWYFLQKGSKIFSIKVQMKDETSQYKLHFLKQLVHSIWQIIAVGGGAPIGKSAAPREIGALFARPIANIFSLSVKDQVFLIACGAGAGLAAVYFDYLCVNLYSRIGYFRSCSLPDFSYCMVIKGSVDCPFITSFLNPLSLAFWSLK